ncbi:hypothetical protein ACFE04_029835 [Oxalis oulophora]
MKTPIILKAKKVVSGSCIWKGLLATRKVLLKVGGWRIGDGFDVSVVDDNWVTGVSSAELRVNPLSRAVPDKVYEFIRSPAGGWDVGLLKQCFPKEQVDAILSITLCDRRVEDQFIWLDNNKGQYFVNEGYKVACDVLYSNVQTFDPHNGFSYLTEILSRNGGSKRR